MEKETMAGAELPYFICLAFAAVDFKPFHGGFFFFLTLPMRVKQARPPSLFLAVEKILM